MNKLSISVVVLNWNGREFIGKCLDSLLAQSTKNSIIVIENGSNDGSANYIKSIYPRVNLIVCKKNYGFAGGANIGIEAAISNGADYVALLNNDAVADRNWLKHLIKAARSCDEVGIVTSKFLRCKPKKYIDSTGDFYSIWGRPFPRGRDELDRGRYDSIDQRFVFGASGGASLYKIDMLRKIGLFDEAFFAYYEDVDISFRAQLAGWKVLYEPRSVAYHEVGRTASRLGNFTRYHSMKNFIYLYTKNMPGWLYWKYLPTFWIGLMTMLVNTIRQKQTNVILPSLWKATNTLPKMLLRRWQIQKKRKATVGYIDSILIKKMPDKYSVLHKIGQRIKK